MTTYNLIETATVGSGGAASIVFSSIPATYTDLKIVASLRNTSTGSQTLLSFNGSTASFTGKYLLGVGSGTPSSGSLARYTGPMSLASFTANVFGNSEIYIPNYLSSSYKSFSADTVTENNSTTAYMALTAGLWSVASAITSVTLTPDNFNFAEFSSASLYGISNS
tara:strand:+ start:86 stop:583 length:498 start_codon:yes stop_codon:yes gene_type:complete